MTDLYIRREEPSKRPIIIAVVLIAIIAVGVIIYNIRGRSGPEPEETDQPSTQVAEATTSKAPVKERAKPPPPPKNKEKKRTVSEQVESINQVAGGANLLTEARSLVAQGKLQEAREASRKVLAGSSGELATQAEDLLGEIHISMVFSPYPMPEKEDYTVQPGDSLDRISKKFGTTVELVQKGNNISGSLIHAGDRFRILQGDFNIVVDKTRNDMVVNLNNEFFKRYRVGTGEYGKTPVGTFKITDKIKHPPWWRPDGKQIPYGDPENLLGTHWLSINIKGYGIHGTWEPETIGKQASAGCVRLLNEEVEELYALVTLGTPVVINE